MDTNIVIDNRVRVDVSALTPDVIQQLKAAFEHKNPEYAQKKFLKVPGWWSVPKMLPTWKHDPDGRVSFPRGGFGKVRGLLASEGYDYFVEDKRVLGAPIPAMRHNVELYPHQDAVIAAALKKEQCIIRAPTGSGKTTALLAIAARVQVPTLVVVHSRGLFDQWFERAQRELGLKARDIGVLQGQRKRLKPLTIAIQKTLANVAHLPEVRDYFGCVIADEVHLFAAKTFMNAVDPFGARYRIGASADHRRKDKKEFLIHDLFGDVAADIDREDLVKSGHILDVEVRVVPTDFQADWYGLPEDEPTNPESEEEAKHIDFTRLVQEMAANPARNHQILDIARAVTDEGEQLLVMAHERDHCHALVPVLVGMGLNTGYLIGGPDYATEFRSTIAGLKSGVVRAGVGTYPAIGTGIDLPRVGVAIASTPIASNEQLFNQVRGRVCRTATGKTAARLYYLWDRLVYPRHLSNLSRWNINTVVLHDGAWVPAKQYLKDLAL